jgi:hypothetical protein
MVVAARDSALAYQPERDSAGSIQLTEGRANPEGRSIAWMLCVWLEIRSR